MSDSIQDESLSAGASDRRAFLSSCGKFAVTVPPAMTVLMSTSLVSPAIAQSAGVPSGHCNNGVGNGLDCAPPGNPPVNDGDGSGQGNPGNQGNQGNQGNGHH